MFPCASIKGVIMRFYGGKSSLRPVYYPDYNPVSRRVHLNFENASVPQVVGESGEENNLINLVTY